VKNLFNGAGGRVAHGYIQTNIGTIGHIEPTPTRAPSIGCPLLLSCG